MADRRVRALLDTVGAGPVGDEGVTITGADPVLATPYAVGEAAATALAACGAVLAQLWRAAGHGPQSVAVDVGHAAASLLSLWLVTVDGVPLSPLPPDGNPTTMSVDNPLVALYRTRDEGWFHVHGTFEHLAAPTRTVLGLGPQPSEAEVGVAVRRWDAAALEQALADQGACGAVLRTGAQWRTHPHGAGLADLGPVVVSRIGDAPARPVPALGRPLGGLRVLDATRVLAGPTCGRLLAENGADVLLLTSPRLPEFRNSVIDTGHGKRSAQLDFTTADGWARFGGLARGSDVVVDSYRGGALARHGLGAEDLAEQAPGVICTSITCYGPGPWHSRPGWEHLAQTVTGLAAGHGGLAEPSLVPAAVCDYVTGYLAALGVLVALLRRAEEGGSWRVETSLAQTAMWIEAMGPGLDPAAACGLRVPDDCWVEGDSPFGRLRVLAPALVLSSTPPSWTRLAVPLGTDPAGW